MKNYHTHTYRCHHALGDAVDYAKMAVAQGITVLGITDHTPLPDNRWPSMRMSLEEFPNYLQAIEQAQELYPQLTILKGLECEYAPEYHGFYQDLLDQWGLNYLILGAHFFPCDGEWLGSHGSIISAKRLLAYADYVIKSMESGLFAFVAHPDLFGITYLDWDQDAEACSRDILVAAEELKIPLEINGYGFRKPKVMTQSGQRPTYPWLAFWEVAAEYQISIVATSDAHHPQDVAGNITDGLLIAERLKLGVADLSVLGKL